MQPEYEKPLTSIKNRDGAAIPIQRMPVAYSRPYNLGNLLSYRLLDNSTGPPVSSFIWLQIRVGHREREREKERERLLGFAPLWAASPYFILPPKRLPFTQTFTIYANTEHFPFW